MFYYFQHLLIYLYFLNCTAQQVGSYYPDQGWKQHPLHWNHWTTREVPEERFNEKRKEDGRERRKR